MKTNKKEELASASIIKVVSMILILIFISGVCVTAHDIQINNIKIVLSNNYEIDVISSKTKVSEILEENHILVLPEEKVCPGLEETIGQNKKIKILKMWEQEEIIEIAEADSTISTEDILKIYAPITEKIVALTEEIPYETITKDTSDGASSTTNKILQEGKNGLREVTYKIKYQNDIEVEKIELSSRIIKEPVNKIVQLNVKATSRSTEVARTASANPADGASTSLAKKVEGIAPVTKTMNTSAYCACTRCCGKSNAKTASGATAEVWYTLAAGKGYPIGTVIYIPYFKNKPNGGWFVVQDRGGAISNNKLDVFMGSHNDALSFGRKNLECYIYLP